MWDGGKKTGNAGLEKPGQVVAKLGLELGLKAGNQELRYGPVRILELIRSAIKKA